MLNGFVITKITGSFIQHPSYDGAVGAVLVWNREEKSKDRNLANL